MWAQQKKSQQGTIMVIVILALMALLGMAALTIDVGFLALAAQQAQDVADAAALGAALEVPDYTSGRTVALSLVEANNESSTGFQATCSSGNGDILFWGPYETVPDYGSLDSSTYGVRVTVHIPVHYVFAPVLGLTGTTVTRSSTCVRSRAGAAPIAPGNTQFHVCAQSRRGSAYCSHVDELRAPLKSHLGLRRGARDAHGQRPQRCRYPWLVRMA